MKKKTRLMLAGLMAIAVTGSSTLAYFSDEVNLSGKEGTMLQLKITNGKVDIESAYGDTSTASTWYYDPVDVSDDGRSPDLMGVGSDPGNKTAAVDTAFSTDGRWKKGAPVRAELKLARPGDGFTMGQILDDTTGAELASGDKVDGIKIANNSNLTVKITVELRGEQNSDGWTTDKSYEQYKLLKDAGWKISVNDTEVNDEISGVPSKDNLLTNITAALSGVTSLAVGNDTTLKIHVYLPTETDNTKQELTTSDTVNYPDGFDITKLFVIKAVQENFE